MIHRFISLPLSTNAFNKEKYVICSLARNNHIDLDIDDIIRKKMILKALDQTTLHKCGIGGKKKKQYIRLPFLGEFSFKLARLLKPFNLTPAFYTLNNTT